MGRVSVTRDLPLESLDRGDLLEALVLRSNLLGADRAVANWGGGNTSAKGEAVDHTGQVRDVLWVKGSGSDLATIGRAGFTGLKLDEVVRLRERDAMSDEEMVDYLGRCRLDPGMPRGSIETLMHAFTSHRHVDHTHPDAINVLACAKDAQELIAECFEGRALFVEYIRPGFALAKQIADRLDEDDMLELVVLGKHGLITWGPTSRECYEATLDAIGQAAEFAAGRTARGNSAGASAMQGREDLLLSVLPELRGAVSTSRAKVLRVDDTASSLAFAGSTGSSSLSQVGAACPDHLIHTKRKPLWVPFDPARDSTEDLVARIRLEAEAFREREHAYVRTYGGGEALPRDADPRIVVIEGVGMIGVGTTPAAASVSVDLFERAIAVMSGAAAVSEFVSLSDEESFGVEYWELEQYKLSLAPPPAELEGKVAVVTGGASGIGKSTSDTLAAAGACVAVLDLDAAAAVEAVAGYGDRGLGVSCDVTSEQGVADAFADVVRRFGGVDIVVSNAGIAASAPIEMTALADWRRVHDVLTTGYFLVAREAFRLLKRQGLGGSIIFVGSKNGLVAAKNAAAYASAKAAELHLARCLAEEGGSAGIRVNSVNPDAVLRGSAIWDDGWREARAKGYGVDPDELDEYYRKRNTLQVSIYPEDVAQAILHFASAPRSGKSTGNVLNVDGGVAAAYPR
jgi:rhamnulose-1-phosphate aldolase/alcohol dehydrogenase